MTEVAQAGNQFDIGIALQTAKGQTIADEDVQYRFPVTGGGLAADKVINVIEETSSGRLRNTSYVGAINVDGSPSLAARPDVLGLLLFGIFGAKAVAGSEDPWTHTFTFAADQPYFTMWKKIGPDTGGYYEKYRDCKIISLGLASSAEGIVLATPTIMGLRAFSGALADAVDMDIGSEVFAHHHGDGTMLVETVAVGSIADLNIMIGGDATRIRGTSLYGSHVAEQMRNVTIDTTQLVDWDLLQRFMYGTATPATDDPPSGTVLELASSGLDFKYLIPGTAEERSLKLTATRVQTRIDPVDPNTNGAPLMMNAHHQIFQPVDGSTGLTAILKNGVASYPAVAP
jgi:hypothetical protein